MSIFGALLSKEDDLIDDNEVINKWLWKSCKHEWGINAGELMPSICRKCGMLSDYPTGVYKQPVRWTPELFQMIEDAGLRHKFAVGVNGNLSVWDALKSTPDQKARALAKVIKDN